MTPLEATDIERLRELLAKATPGPLFVGDGGVCTRTLPDDCGNVICLEPERLMAASLARWPDNARLIVAAVNALPALLETATRVKVLEEALRPFAQASVGLNPGAGDRCLVSFLPACQLTIGDLRRARTALTASEDDRGSKGEGEGEGETLLRMLLAFEDEAKPNGIMDCIDNDGHPYQSAAMAGLITHVRLLVEPYDHDAALKSLATQGPSS